MTPIALTIAGSDPGGGAGIQADLKTFHQLRVYGTSAITLITVQNTVRMSRVEYLPPDLIREQIDAVLEDLPPQAAKTGALGTRAAIEAVAAVNFPCPLIVDPVMTGKHGGGLLEPDAVTALKEYLIPKATLVTPNIPEAEALSGLLRINGVDDMSRAAEIIGKSGAAVLLKGGHLEGAPADLLWMHGRTLVLSAVRTQTRHTHGTGCTLSAAIAASIAKGMNLEEAVARAKAFTAQAIETAPALGKGAGPINHWAGDPDWL